MGFNHSLLLMADLLKLAEEPAINISNGWIYEDIRLYWGWSAKAMWLGKNETWNVTSVKNELYIDSTKIRHAQSIGLISIHVSPFVFEIFSML